MSRLITQPYYHKFQITKPGLAAITIRARCKSGRQLNAGHDQDLRAEVNRLRFRELLPEKYIQLFNIPPACNGSKSKGRAQTTVFLTVLQAGQHVLSLIPRHGALVEDIRIRELSGEQKVVFEVEEQAEDGDRRPWFTFVVIDLPLKKFSADVTIEKRVWDSDDVKIIVDGETKHSFGGGKFRFWYLFGSGLQWLVRGAKGEKKRTNVIFEESLLDGIHYIELHTDRTPILHRVQLDLAYRETEAERRAAGIVRASAPLMNTAAREFQVDPVMVGSVIYQEQAANVNFVDSLTDYIGGLLHLNTSVGVGQVRVNTARDLEKLYPPLDPGIEESWPGEDTFVRVERLKDPFTNIRYVAAKLRFSQTRWAQAGFDIKDKPDIWGTLYNIENVKEPLEPHAGAKANDFGKGVAAQYGQVKELMGL